MLNLIKDIYFGTGKTRSENIILLQDTIEETDFSGQEDLEAIFVGLSYDLGFYVEKKSHRFEDPSYFGDNKLKDLLFEFLIELNNIKK